MDQFATHFCRNHDGSWTCTRAGTFDGPGGRIQVAPGSRFYPGTIFMGFDVAAWLDQQLANRASECEAVAGTDRRQGERRQSS